MSILLKKAEKYRNDAGVELAVQAQKQTSEQRGVTMRFPNTESKIYSLGAEYDPQIHQQSELPRAAGHFNFRTTANLAERGRAGQHGACGTVEAGHHFFGDREKSWRSLSA